MDCSNCGATGLSGSFCMDCGSELKNVANDVCESCGADDQRGLFCHMCGTKHGSVNVCPNCKAKHQTGNFCKLCGNSLQSTEEQSIEVATQEFFLEGDFDPGKVKCSNCGLDSHRYRLPGVRVEYCSRCGFGASYLAFD